MKSYDEAFVTGCDEKHEWMLKWFFKTPFGYITIVVARVFYLFSSKF